MVAVELLERVEKRRSCHRCNPCHIAEKEGREKLTFLSTTLIDSKMVAAEGVAEETLEQCQI